MSRADGSDTKGWVAVAVVDEHFFCDVIFCTMPSRWVDVAGSTRVCALELGLKQVLKR